ncbi:MAG: nucleoside kinase [Lachnospiraceae bacterium]|nr:nucleoside kinase [Candidatus Minthocola equi]
MRIIDFEDITNDMRDETAFVMRCEEEFHDKVSEAAAAVVNAIDDGRTIVCLTGPSGSGKTTTAMRLMDYIRNLGIAVNMISMDNFFISLSERPEDITSLEDPRCVDRDLLIDCVQRLADGKTVDLPVFDFQNSRRDGSKKMRGHKDGIIIVEGIHMLNPLIFDELKDRATGLYVAPETRVVTNDDKVLRPEEIRVARRMLRDYIGRGHSLIDTIQMAESVNEGEKKYIRPYRDNAQLKIDTFHDYEPCILAQYLRDIPEFDEQMTTEFARAHKKKYLKDIVRKVPPHKTKYVPLDSLLREFVGGSKYKY